MQPDPPQHLPRRLAEMLRKQPPQRAFAQVKQTAYLLQPGDPVVIRFQIGQNIRQNPWPGRYLRPAGGHPGQQRQRPEYLAVGLRPADRRASWSEPVLLLSSDQGGLYYMTMRRLLVPTDAGAAERWFFAVYGHPVISKDHTVRCGLLDEAGRVLRCDGSDTGRSLFGTASPVLEIPELEIAYETPETESVRLLAVFPTEPLRVAIAAFPGKTYARADYRILRFREGRWQLSAPLCENLECLAPGQTDGSQTYVGGMEFYFGAGDAALCELHGSDNDTDRVFAAYRGPSDWILESYVTHDGGRTYPSEQVIRRIPASTGRKLWRPTVPAFAQDNLPVYWHEGTYTAHTGGWHCDVNMLIDYDD